MKVTHDARFVMQSYAEPVKPALQSVPAALLEEPAATLELSEDALRPWNGKDTPWSQYDPSATSRAAKEKMDVKSSGPRDESGRLTRRLVASSSQGEVRSIVSEAYQNLSEWLKAAMSGGPESQKAWAAIKRLNKLIRRAQRKIGDLDKEDLLRMKQKRAEKNQEEIRAQQIKTELYRRIQERKLRERRYLRDAGSAEDKQKSTGPDLSPAALQSKIDALAEQLAQVSAPPAISPAAEPNGDALGGESTAESGGDGGEAAAAEGESVSEA